MYSGARLSLDGQRFAGARLPAVVLLFSLLCSLFGPAMLAAGAPLPPSASAQPETQATGIVDVQVGATGFSPPEITIAPGTTVRFTNTAGLVVGIFSGPASRTFIPDVLINAP